MIASFKSTQMKKLIGQAKQTADRVGFTEGYAKLHKFVPSSAHYKEVDKGFTLTGAKTFTELKSK